jgi:hypothetical protein
MADPLLKVAESDRLVSPYAWRSGSFRAAASFSRIPGKTVARGNGLAFRPPDKTAVEKIEVVLQSVLTKRISL